MKNRIKEVLTQCALSALGAFLVSVGNGLSTVVQEQISVKASEKVSKVDWNKELNN